jgi:purine-binding chemotaxis protein CheW
MLIGSALLSAPVVTLGIDREVFAVPVHAVREILDLGPLCRLPDSPPHLAGLIDVRGHAVPVIDLRIRLGLPAIPPTDSTRVLVLDIDIGGRALALGLIADRVFEVAEIDPATIGPPPDIGTAWHARHIHAIGRHGKDFVIILDLAALLSNTDLALLAPHRQTSLVDGSGGQQ